MASLDERVKLLEGLVKGLQGQVTELQDERAIRELLARYGFNADMDRTDAFVGLYTKDGGIDLGPGDRYMGHDSVRKWISTRPARTDPGVHGKRVHLQGNNVVCHIKGDEAIVNSYSLPMFLEPPGSPQKYRMSAGVNRWTLKKMGGKWLIQERWRRELGAPDYRKALDDTPD